MIVVDASVAVKWYVAETLEEQAAKLFDVYQGVLVVPDVFLIEVVATMVRRANVDKSLKPESERSIANFLALYDAGVIETRHLSADDLAKSARLAIEMGHPLKDCIYLALAMELGCPLVTADARFADKARGVYGDVRGLGEAG